MKIAIIAPLAERVPPRKYGGTERVIYHLTEGLVKRGHDVTLFASGDSITSAKLVSVIPTALRELPDAKDIYGFNTHSLLNMGLAYARQNEFDIIHDHNAHMGLPTANMSKTPVVMTWHGPYDDGFIEYFSTLSKPHLVSISNSQRQRAPGLNFAGTVYNGLAMEEYPFGAKADGYLLFVGRIDKEKGVHHAIDAAVALKTKLIIAAKLDSDVPMVKKYFENYIKPRLKKYPKLIQWVGEVDEAQRNKLMSGAIALLHAVTWPEPFGLTLIEAMACGCPVVGFKQGSIPEVVSHGKTGFVVTNVREMVEAVKNIGSIDRAYCREYALTNFNADRMAAGYEEVYNMAIAKARGVLASSMQVAPAKVM